MTIGFGCQQFDIAVYIANRPNMAEYQNLTAITPLNSGEIYAIGQACGNGWRKVFNVYAKMIYALNKQQFSHLQSAKTWQIFRDQYLLQKHSKTALIFSPPQIVKSAPAIHIICGRTHAKALINNNQLDAQLVWLNQEFAVDKNQRLIVCPYFDYRQLSNIKIDYLSELISQF